MELIIIDDEMPLLMRPLPLLIIEADDSVGDMHRSALDRRELAMPAVDGRRDATMVIICRDSRDRNG